MIDRRFEQVSNLQYEGTARGLVVAADRGDVRESTGLLPRNPTQPRFAQTAVCIDLELEVSPGLIGIQLQRTPASGSFQKN